MLSSRRTLIKHSSALNLLLVMAIDCQTFPKINISKRSGNVANVKDFKQNSKKIVPHFKTFKDNSHNSKHRWLERRI
jgi:hypothetical protein